MTKQQQIEQLQMQIQSLTDELKLKQQTIEDIQAKIEQDEADAENKQYQDFVKCNGILLERYVHENTDFMRESIVNVVKELSINAESGECQYGEENYTNLTLSLGEDKISETSFYNEN